MPTRRLPSMGQAELARHRSKVARARSRLRSYSLRKLIKSTLSFREKRRINNTGTAEILAARLSKTKSPYLIVNSQVRGTKLWQQTLHFPATVTSDEPTLETPVPIDLGHGNVKWIAKVTPDDPVMVRCNCPDYQHTYSHQNFKVKSLQGRRIPYQKVPGSNRGPRNPDDIPGMCKHLISVVDLLQKERGPYPIIKPFPESFSTSVAGYRWST